VVPYIGLHRCVNRKALDLASLIVETFFYEYHSSIVFKCRLGILD
jgi:hypothetical protein